MTTSYETSEMARQMIEQRISRASEDRLAHDHVRFPEPRRHALARRLRRVADAIDN
ncbi:hypothetical protein [Nocardioides jensenii]|uniref:hypothetical protein n=1 Tax=Nocardioides jensenii TaxID=1843 RepID=UPI000A96A597|nr:hypothetical protein [Nocardioides jensenii]